MTGVTV